MKPAIERSSVVLPQPLGPSSISSSPLATETLTRSRMVAASKRTDQVFDRDRRHGRDDNGKGGCRCVDSPSSPSRWAPWAWSCRRSRTRTSSCSRRASWAQQGDLGDPQKEPPCGAAPATAAATGVVTAFAPGDMVTVMINETVPHPGHYRVALSTSGQGGLPADPVVTPTAGDACGSTVIQSPPVFPVLADGMLAHTSAFSTPQTFSFRLPTDVTCTSNCVLQVVEYMSSHGAPCFYHHCANITIQAGGGDDGGAGSDGGTSRTPAPAAAAPPAASARRSPAWRWC